MKTNADILLPYEGVDGARIIVLHEDEYVGKLPRFSPTLAKEITKFPMLPGLWVMAIRGLS